MALPEWLTAKVIEKSVPYIAGTIYEGGKLTYQGIKKLWNWITDNSVKDMSDEALQKLLGDAYYPEARLDLKKGRLKLAPGMSPAIAQAQAQSIRSFRQQNSALAGREIPDDAWDAYNKITFISPEQQRVQQIREKLGEGLPERMQTSLSKLENLEASPLEQESAQAFQQMLPQLQQEAFGPTPTASFPSAIARQNRQQQPISPQSLQALQFLAPYVGKASKWGYEEAQENIPKAYQAGKTRLSQGLSKLGF